MKPVVLAVGHSRANDKGASSVDGTFEWDYNVEVCYLTEQILEGMGVPAIVVENYGNIPDYQAAINWLARFCKQVDAKCVTEHHFNSYDGSADQEEYLHWHTSSGGLMLANAIHDAHQANDPNPRTRGVKARSSGRGAYFLRKTPCPAVICEPFFGDHTGDWSHWGHLDGKRALAAINAQGIARFYGA